MFSILCFQKKCWSHHIKPFVGFSIRSELRLTLSYGRACCSYFTHWETCREVNWFTQIHTQSQGSGGPLPPPWSSTVLLLAQGLFLWLCNTDLCLEQPCVPLPGKVTGLCLSLPRPQHAPGCLLCHSCFWSSMPAGAPEQEPLHQDLHPTSRCHPASQSLQCSAWQSNSNKSTWN